jgi:2-phosphoxylose phosphatase
MGGKETYKLRLYVGHDGSMIRLASGLGIGKPGSDGTLRWPALGSEIVFEVWRVGKSSSSSSGSDVSHVGLYARVMHEGTPVEGLEWVPVEQMVALLESNVPSDLFNKCTE